MADEKAPPRTSLAGSNHGTARIGSVAEIDDLTQLGYKPEMARNRSMYTLLFQSLAIAAIRMCQKTAKWDIWRGLINNIQLTAKEVL